LNLLESARPPALILHHQPSKEHSRLKEVMELHPLQQRKPKLPRENTCYQKVINCFTLLITQWAARGMLQPPDPGEPANKPSNICYGQPTTWRSDICPEPNSSKCVSKGQNILILGRNYHKPTLLNVPQKVQDAKCVIIHFGLQIHLSKEIPQIKDTNIQGPCKTIWLLAFRLGTKANRWGAISAIYCPCIHLSNQTRVYAPSPTSVQTAMEKKAHTY